ncbi:hypothetical protein I5J35_gp57 [Mycobacterium phage Rem711]|uniref:Uncharacterized protein n=1 Tax=Mycobacterium phage Rem711 TaxID=2079285 RepID=A0A2K9VEZ7_9CAUD|nr:hypothetical protein I5J35_gp57 [Mycobacterium phage Rem711]AUV60835.1 hypothetical protein SEA_REM711_57 [Mycobacterium phage Rem711]
MGVDTTTAADHPSTNELDKIDDGGVDTGGAYIGFRATNIKLETPPAIGDSGRLVVQYECVGDGRRKAADGELRDTRSLKVIAVWPAGEKPPASAVEQPAMFTSGGAVTADAAGDDEDGEIPDDDADDDNAVDAPQFSDGDNED